MLNPKDSRDWALVDLSPSPAIVAEERVATIVFIWKTRGLNFIPFSGVIPAIPNAEYQAG